MQGWEIHIDFPIVLVNSIELADKEYQTLAKDFLIDGRRIKLFGFLRITAGGLGLGAQLTPRG